MALRWPWRAAPAAAAPRLEPQLVGAPAAASAAPAVMAFEAGRSARRLADMPRSARHINSLIRSYGRTVLARSRYLATNNPYARLAMSEFVSAFVGAGIKPSSQIADPAIRAAVAQAWLDWTDESDADQVTDFYGQQRLAGNEMFGAGECFARLRPRRPEDGLTVPLQLQLLPAEMLPYDLNLDLGGGRRIECGIEFGPLGQRLAYHFLRRHPGDDLGLGVADPTLYTVVPASEVLHLFDPIWPGQIRGIPHTLAGLVTAVVHDSYEDAELERKRIAAMFGAFIKRPAVTADPLLDGAADGTPTAERAATPDSRGDFPLQPGMGVDLAPGEDVVFAEPADVGGNFEAAEYRFLLRMSAGFGTPYHLMTGDLRQVNFSSIRAGMVAFRRRVEALQHAVMVWQFCRVVWLRWIDAAVIAGAVPIPARAYAAGPREWRRVKWMTPKWEWVNPRDDAEAEKLAVDNGWKARSDVIESLGEEPEEVDRRRLADQEREEALGIHAALPAAPSAPADPMPADPHQDPSQAQPPVAINIPTPWPHGEVTEVLAHDALGRVTRFRKRPATASE